jgi:hypothetical protein
MPKNMSEAGIFKENAFEPLVYYRGTHPRNLFCHSQDKISMPMRAGWKVLIDLFGDTNKKIFNPINIIVHILTQAFDLHRP